MITLPNMGLVKWNEITDFFSHSQLAANFQKLDEHDHTAGKGVQIPFGGLANLSVGPENLRSEAFVASKLAAGSIEESKIKDGAVTSRKFKPTVGIVTATEDLTLNTSYADVPGATLTITPAVSSKLRIWAIFEFDALKSYDQEKQTAIGSLKVGSEAEQTRVATASITGPTGESSVGITLHTTESVVYDIPISAETTVKLRAKREGSAVLATPKLLHANTHFAYMLVSS